jgi:hypothetical protein
MLRKSKFLSVIGSVGFTLTLVFQTAIAEPANKVPVKESSLIAHLVKKANQRDSHGEEDVYLWSRSGNRVYH